MADVVSPEKRSRMMSGIRSTNTKPELTVRKSLHRRGFRYRLHDKRLTGKPDLVLPKHNAVIFVNGCFWHGHNCKLFKLPKSNHLFWSEKIHANKSRDEKNCHKLLEQGWKVITIWECALRGTNEAARQKLFDLVEESIKEKSGRMTFTYE
ncbi:very short patch repair endonuclease [Thalassospiraceae bacterium SW-3-3]|nr:very short patch repair endonuclease [Thalassospiraceae bacterium SW-3-3]